MKTKYLTLDEVLAIHDNMVSLYGGSHGTRDLGLIESAIARPQASFGGEDLYTTIFVKAAAFFHSLIFNHAFVDVNKRTTITATAFFLSKNGYELDTSDEEFVAFPVRVENEHLDLEEIAKWLKDHTSKV